MEQALLDHIVRDSGDAIPNDVLRAVVTAKTVDLAWLPHPGCTSVYVPVVYLLSMRAEYVDAMKYVLSLKPNLAFIVEEPVPPMLLTCHSLYLQHLMQNGATLSMYSTKKQAELLAQRFVSRGWKRVHTLHTHGAVSDAVAKLAFANKPGLMVDVLQHERSQLCAYVMQREQGASTDGPANPREAGEDVVRHIQHALEYFLRFNAASTLTREFHQQCVDLYLHEVLSDARIRPHVPSTITPTYHERMPRAFLVALLRPLLNDRRYELTCRALGTLPDEALTKPYF